MPRVAMSTFERTVRHAMIDHDVTDLATLAAVARIGQPTLSNYLAGRRAMPLEVTRAIAAAFKLDPDELIGQAELIPVEVLVRKAEKIADEVLTEVGIVPGDPRYSARWRDLLVKAAHAGLTD